MDEFILALFVPGDKLKATTLYQLLTGKKTTSVLLFGCFHDLLPYFGLFPEWGQRNFQDHLQALKSQGYLQSVSEDFYQLEKVPAISVEKREVLSSLNHFAFGKSEAPAWRMVKFVVQVASMYQRERTFVPLETAPVYTEPVRLLIRQHQRELRERLGQELTCLFEVLPQNTGDTLARSFTGRQQVGQATYQLLPSWVEKQPWKALVPIAWHQAFFAVLQRHKEFILYQLVAPFFLRERNQSSLQTQALFEAGCSFAEVVARRNLKPGTINDHVIEWALNEEQFDFDAFISVTDREFLTQKAGKPTTWRYKDVAEDGIDFLSFALFQIQSKEAGGCS